MIIDYPKKYTTHSLNNCHINNNGNGVPLEKKPAYYYSSELSGNKTHL